MKQRACLLLVDLQQDFLARPGLTPPATILVEQLATLLAAWRGLCLPVVHSQTLIQPDGGGRMPHWQRAGHWACVEGSPGALPPPALAPLPGETVLSKPFFSAFGNAQLEPLLRKLNAEILVVAGIYTHACVRATVLDAYQNHFQVWVAIDGIASDDPLHADLTLRYLEQRACKFLRGDDILRRLGSPPVIRPATSAGLALPSVYTGGRWRNAESDAIWTQHNPTDWGETLAELRIGDARDVELAACQAAARQAIWRNEAVDRRMLWLSRWADAMQRRRDAFVALLVREVGKPLPDARAEFGYAMALLQAVLCRESPETEECLASQVWLQRRPLGVVGLITPWNNPLAIPVGKIAPALACGNTVLWKPALPTPGVVMLLLETLAEAGLPDDCVNVVFGDAGTAQAVIRHPRVAAVSFTGSEVAGRQVAALCATDGKALQAELGGNNAVLACGDCDVDAVAAEVVHQAFSFAGQRCTAPRRLIVERHYYDEWIGCLVAHTAALRIGDPADATTQLGPLVSRNRQAEIASQVAASIKEDAHILYGGKIPAGFEQGCWYEPTLVADAQAAARIVQEESFGPVLVVQQARDFEEALRLCNGVSQGLVATLYSHDPVQRKRFLREAEAGILRIGSGQGSIHPEAPFSGWKSSGIGLPEHGRWDGEFYTRPQAVYGVLNTTSD